MVELTDEQEAVAEAAMDFVERGRTLDGRKWFSFEGLAGTGKSTVLIELARRLPRASMASLFGKAASNLAVKTGMSTSTIHALIYRLVGEDIDERGRRELYFTSHVADGRLASRVFLIDESGVVPEEVGYDLMRTGALVIAAGDPGQLPPVKGRRFFSRPGGPDARLETVHRQAWDSGIIRQAWAVRQNGRYAADGDEMQVTSHVSGDMIVEADILLCWRNVTRRGLINLKRRWLNLPAGRLARGEPVMCLLNQHEIGLMNGQVVILAEGYRRGDERICVEMNGEAVEIDQPWVEDVDAGEFDWSSDGVPFASGWASTVHKAIGSEYDFVVLSDEYSRGDSAREWRYTGITRGAKRCIVVR